jgi:hypothetical protein
MHMLSRENATAEGDVGRNNNSRRRCLFKKKHEEVWGASGVAACVEVRTHGSVRTSVCYRIVRKVRRGM